MYSKRNFTYIKKLKKKYIRIPSNFYILCL